MKMYSSGYAAFGGLNNTRSSSDGKGKVYFPREPGLARMFNSTGKFWLHIFTETWRT